MALGFGSLSPVGMQSYALIRGFSGSCELLISDAILYSCPING